MQAYSRKSIQEPRVVIIIPNWNGLKLLKIAIPSIIKINYSNYKIIVVDNGSKDSSIEWIRNNYPDTKVINCNKNLGFAGGCNVGIKYANNNYNPDYFLMLNNDIKATPQFLKESIKLAENNKNIGIVGSKVLNFNDNKIQSLGYSITKSGKSIPNNKLNKKIDFVSGVAMLIKKTVIKNIGLFDEKYFMYLEDRDYCYRAKKGGYKIKISSNSVIYHVSQGSSKNNIDKKLALLRIVNRFRFVIKNYAFGEILSHFFKGELVNIKEYISKRWLLNIIMYPLAIANVLIQLPCSIMFRLNNKKNGI